MVGQFSTGLVHGVFERDLVAAAPAAVGRMIARTAPQSLTRSAMLSALKPGEDDGMGRADTGARQHRDRQLGDHAEVDRHAIALLDAQTFERRRGAIYLGGTGRDR